MAEPANSPVVLATCSVVSPAAADAVNAVGAGRPAVAWSVPVPIEAPGVTRYSSGGSLLLPPLDASLLVGSADTDDSLNVSPTVSPALVPAPKRSFTKPPTSLPKSNVT